MNRVDKTMYYLYIAHSVSLRSTCLYSSYGCVIVKNDEIISTGYNGAPRGVIDCLELGYCTRRKQLPNVKSQQNYELCKAVHAEQNAIISASRKDMIDATMYIYGRDLVKDVVKSGMPCDICKKMILNSGISKVIISIENTDLEYKVLEDLTNLWK